MNKTIALSLVIFIVFASFFYFDLHMGDRTVTLPCIALSGAYNLQEKANSNPHIPFEVSLDSTQCGK